LQNQTFTKGVAINKPPHDDANLFRIYW